METLQIKKTAAIEAYNKGDERDRNLLENLFGKQIFIIDVCERVKTLEDACRETSRDYSSVFNGISDPYKQAEKAIEIFAEALREGKPVTESWYHPYFYRSSGGGFSCDGCADGHDYSCVGARLRVDTSAKAKHLGNCMLPYYKTYINGK
jgi:hypothetical protein